MINEFHRSFLLAAWLVSLWILPGRLSADSYYVTPTGAAPYDGTSWGSAFSNVQAAATLATKDGDAIFLQWGVYSNASQIVISNAVGLTVHGGCAGTGGDPDSYSGTNSTLTKTGGVMRILYGYASTVTLHGVTVEGGSLPGNNRGAGIYAAACGLTLSNCVVRSNRISAVNSTWSYGAGLYASTGTLALLNCVFSNNAAELADNSHAYGGGVYFSGATLAIRDTRFASNRVSRASAWWQTAAGGAVYASATGISISNSAFADNNCVVHNTVGGMTEVAYGGALYLAGGDAEVVGCGFTNNGVAAQDTAYGGTLCAVGLTSLVVQSCGLTGTYSYSCAGGDKHRGSALYLSGVATARVSACQIRPAESTVALSDTVRIESCGRIAMRDTELEGSTLHGIRLNGGALEMTNCLVVRGAGDGLYLTAGTATVQNATLADNLGWGLNCAGGAAGVTNSIAWGNGRGGISSAAGVSVDYSCCQNAVGGVSNLLQDPWFVYSYYLSVSGLLGQAESSPCLDYGNASPAALGLTNRTTRTDGTGDTNAWVDLGYHYAAGVADLVLSNALSNAVLYVDAAGGSDANDGRTAGTALKTLGAGLGRVSPRGTIHLAAGGYNAANGEVFPLTLAATHVTIAGTNPAGTVADAGGGNRVFYAVNRGAVVLEGLTIQGGRLAGGNQGAGFYSLGCDLTLSNCVVRSNRISYANGATSYGAGMYGFLGTVTLVDCLVSNNFLLVSDAAYAYGGGGFVSGGGLTIRNSFFANNRMTNFSGHWNNFGAGGAVGSSGSSVSISNSSFVGNGLNPWNGNLGNPGYGYGGALYLSGGDALLVDCGFTNNYVVGADVAYGGSLYATSVTSLTVRACTFNQGYAQSIDTGTERGGAMYLASSTGTLIGCRIQGVGTTNDYVGDTYIASGSVAITNTLFADNNGNGITAAGGNLSVVNCTLAGNAGWGLTNAVAMTAVRNSIAWGNTNGGIASNAIYVSVSYTCSQEASPHAGDGNIITNPVFVDAAAGDYHLQSRGGSYHDAASAYVLDASNSPCIDAGDGSDYSLEPAPNGARINLGAYGNTVQASKTPLRVTNAGGAVNKTESAADLLGELVSTGAAPATVYCFWGTNDAGQVKGNWGASSNLGVCASGAALSNHVVGLSSDHRYYYRYYASNGLDEAWAEPAATFLPLTPPSVDNDGGAIPGRNRAVLRGTLLDGGEAEVWIYWGTNADSWSETNALGTVPEGGFQVVVSNLLEDTEYYYRCYGSNLIGTNWAASYTNFRTLAADGNYVTPEGAGLKNGLGWENAFDSIQAAVDSGTNAGDCVYLKHGDYPLGASLAISNRAAFSFLGGYMGVGSPGATTNVNSVLFRQSVSNFRILAVNASTVTLAGVTVEGGSLPGNNRGAGIYAAACGLTLSNCVVRSNRISAVNSTWSYGAGLYASTGTLALLNCVFSNNAAELADNSHAYGGGVYFSGATLAIRDTRFASNRVSRASAWWQTAAGGAVYASATGISISNSAFADNNCVVHNTVGGMTEVAYGGALYLAGGDAEVVGCGFTNNGVAAQDTAYGGTLCAVGLTSLVVQSCGLTGTYSYSCAGGDKHRGSALYLSGVATARVSACQIRPAESTVALSDTVRIESCGRIAMRDTELEGSTLHGIRLNGGALEMTNCLVVRGAGDGLYLTAGTATVQNATLADNLGWGLNCAGGAAGVTNSIAWGNGRGGISSAAGVSVDYSCCQNAVGGVSNLLQDPWFVYSYYLSVSGLLGQAESSPCLDYGNASPAALGLTNRTTRTDGTGDTNAWVDLGYHYAAGVADLVLSNALSNAVLYVDAAGGSDANDGRTAGTALKTLGAGLGRVSPRGTIHLAAGGYNAANGEVFPLTLAATHVTIAGTNPAGTVADAGGGNRVFYAVNRGAVVLEGLTIQGGRLAGGNQGAGFYSLGCDLTLSNCVVRSNRISYADFRTSQGAGLYGGLGTLSLLDCVVSDNAVILSDAAYGYGGGVYFSGSELALVGSRFESNHVARTNNHNNFGYGGAVYSGGAGVSISNCAFVGNSVTPWNGTTGNPGIGYGGAVCLSGGDAEVSGSGFTNNWVVGWNAAYGGALYANGLTSLAVRGCAFNQGYAQSSGAGTERGGSLYLAASNSVLIGCRVQGVGMSEDYVGDIYVASGPAALTNTLVAGNGGNGVTMLGQGLTLARCTVADNKGAGISIGSGTLAVRDSIIWGNALGGLVNGAGAAAAYTCLQELSAGVGNFSADPLFVDPAAGEYHLMSTVGSWHDGAWTPDAFLSPCIDAGDPAADWTAEPKPNRGRVNLGAYGNTPEASRSPQGTVFRAR